MADVTRGDGNLTSTTLARAVGAVLSSEEFAANASQKRANARRVINGTIGNFPEIIAAVESLPEADRAAVALEQAAVLTSATQAGDALAALGLVDGSSALLLSEKLVWSGVLKKRGSGGSSGDDLCGLGLAEIIDAIEVQNEYVESTACPMAKQEGQKCPIEAKGTWACKVGSTIFESFLDGLLGNDGPQCSLVKTAVEMWKNTHVVNGIKYPGGYCLECSATGSSLGPNDVFWTIFSINACGGTRYQSASTEPCPSPDIPIPSDPRCTASFFDITPDFAATNNMSPDDNIACTNTGSDWPGHLYMSNSPICRVPSESAPDGLYCLYIGAEEYCKIRPECYIDETSKQCVRQVETPPGGGGGGPGQ